MKTLPDNFTIISESNGTHKAHIPRGSVLTFCVQNELPVHVAKGYYQGTEELSYIIELPALPVARDKLQKRLERLACLLGQECIIHREDNKRNVLVHTNGPDKYKWTIGSGVTYLCEEMQSQDYTRIGNLRFNLHLGV